MTRLVYILFVLISTALNGLALGVLLGQLKLTANFIQSVLLFDLIVFPIAIYAAYRLGEMAEAANAVLAGAPRADTSTSIVTEVAQQPFKQPSTTAGSSVH